MFIWTTARAQTGVSYYTHTFVGVDTPLLEIAHKKLIGELKIATSRKGFELATVATEIDLFYPALSGEFHHLNLGFGIQVDVFGRLTHGNSFVLPVQLSLSPWKKAKRFRILFELAPTLNFEGDQGNLRSLAGIRYSLTNPSRSN